jgi:hypothetical protein
MELSYIPWFAWIAIAGIIFAGFTIFMGSRDGGKAQLVEALKQNAEVNEKLIARLDGIDSRLGSVEKTLNDIPG